MIADISICIFRELKTWIIDEMAHNSSSVAITVEYVNTYIDTAGGGTKITLYTSNELKLPGSRVQELDMCLKNNL